MPLTCCGMAAIIIRRNAKDVAGMIPAA